MVNGNQFAFIKHKHILDSVLIANECIESPAKKEERVGGQIRFRKSLQ